MPIPTPTLPTQKHLAPAIPTTVLPNRLIPYDLCTFVLSVLPRILSPLFSTQKIPIYLLQTQLRSHFLSPTGSFSPLTALIPAPQAWCLHTSRDPRGHSAGEVSPRPLREQQLTCELLEGRVGPHAKPLAVLIEGLQPQLSGFLDGLHSHVQDVVVYVSAPANLPRHKHSCSLRVRPRCAGGGDRVCPGTDRTWLRPAATMLGTQPQLCCCHAFSGTPLSLHILIIKVAVGQEDLSSGSPATLFPNPWHLGENPNIPIQKVLQLLGSATWIP